MNAAAIAATEPIRPLSRAEYDRLVDLGVFDGEKVELLWGLLVEMSPQGAEHWWPIGVLNRLFMRHLGDRADIRVQAPFAASDTSQPEPDLALVALSDEWRRRHPGEAFLVVEVARSSQRIDHKKLALYATAGVPEAWIVDLAAEVVEVFTEPDGDLYRQRRVVASGGEIVLVAFPDVKVVVAELLP